MRPRLARNRNDCMLSTTDRGKWSVVNRSRAIEREFWYFGSSNSVKAALDSDVVRKIKGRYQDTSAMQQPGGPT